MDAAHRSLKSALRKTKPRIENFTFGPCFDVKEAVSYIELCSAKGVPKIHYNPDCESLELNKRTIEKLNPIGQRFPGFCVEIMCLGRKKVCTLIYEIVEMWRQDPEFSIAFGLRICLWNAVSAADFVMFAAYTYDELECYQCCFNRLARRFDFQIPTAFKRHHTVSNIPREIVFPGTDNRLKFTFSKEMLGDYVLATIETVDFY